ncbi:hypothetical protein Y032_0405g874 [Ancylostoma ceylanicum]|uniref:Uncharacterized protein n=1 Tax=Ancylostoma ceylanicum TaxID=53326 RepID=A0A016X2X6_9BILA|nr:hypothetical protein Y032_0405g874 [Ancylostoma ceylanicum]
MGVATDAPWVRALRGSDAYGFDMTSHIPYCPENAFPMTLLPLNNSLYITDSMPSFIYSAIHCNSFIHVFISSRKCFALTNEKAKIR